MEEVAEMANIHMSDPVEFKFKTTTAVNGYILIIHLVMRLGVPVETFEIGKWES